MRRAYGTIRKEIVNHQTLVCTSNLYDDAKHHLVARISSRITTVIRIVKNTEETIAVLPSHSQFRCTIHSYLHLHGLVLETSIYHWQDQPGSYSSTNKKKNAGKSFRSLLRSRSPPSDTARSSRGRVGTVDFISKPIKQMRFSQTESFTWGEVTRRLPPHTHADRVLKLHPSGREQQHYGVRFRIRYILSGQSCSRIPRQ